MTSPLIRPEYGLPSVAHVAIGGPRRGSARAVPVEPTTSHRRGVATDDVVFDRDSFWGRRQEVNGGITLEHCFDWMERLGWVENFDRIARHEATIERAGWMFSDSEVYKLLEAMAWEIARTGDARVEAMFAGLVARVGAAQDADGYLNTAFGHDGLPPRYSDLSMGHELYNTGHLLQAAVARLRTAGDDELVAIARRAADHVCREFGDDGRDGLCGHPGIEVALAEFGRATGEFRYIEQARLFVERRGHGTLPVRPLLSAEYFQDDVPVRQAEVLRGHAVRALYLSAGAVDVAVETSDAELLRSLERQWARTVERRTYLTGGMGSRHQDEGFGDDFELPPDRAYCETCAGVASVMLAWRLYLATGEAVYVDLIERTLFNVIAASPRQDGRAFFYANPLHLREAGDAGEQEGVHHRAEGGLRAPWFDVSCCPTNVARTLAALQAYTASVERGPAADIVALLQYTAGDLRVRTGGGEDELVLRVDTHYPDDGRIRVEVVGAPAWPVQLRLRVPGWADSATLAESGAVPRRVAPGWVDVGSTLAPGDVIDLDLGVHPRLTWPDPRVDAVRGTVAVERGPVVLALESTDLPAGVDLDAVRLDSSVLPRAEHSGDGAIVRISVREAGPVPSGRPPFGARPPEPGEVLQADVPLVPYHRWAERGPSTMRVFIPTPE